MKILSKFLAFNFTLISTLISYTIIFSDSQMIKGELIKIRKEHPFDPETRTEEEVFFKV